MKKNGSHLLIILLIINLFIQIKCMNYSENLKQKKLMPSDHPALIPDKNVICYLKKVPREILNLIAEFLIFSEEETDAEFLERIEEIKEKKYRSKKLTQDEINSIETPYGTVFINSSGNLKITNLDTKWALANYFLPGKYLIKVENYYTYRNAITLIRASKTKKQIVALEREIEKPTGEFNKVVIWYVDPKNQKSQKLLCNKIPKEEISRYYDDRIINSLNKGYVKTYVYNGVTKLKNTIQYLAISSDGKKIAIANNNQIFLAKKNQNNNWENFICIKSFTIPQFNSVPKQSTQIATHYDAIDFNKQSTKLGILTKNNEFETILIEPERIKTLTDYFRQKLVCKEFMTK